MVDHDDDDFDDAADALTDEPDGGEQPIGAAMPDESPDLVSIPGDFTSSDADAIPKDKASPHSPEHMQALRDSPARTIPAVERHLRVNTVAQMRLQGWKREQIHRYVAEHLAESWGVVATRTLDRYISQADTIIRDGATRDLDLERGKAAARFDELYRLSVHKGMLGTALRVVGRAAKFYGLDAPVKVRHGNDPDNPLPVPSSTQFYVLIQEVDEG